jgi:hypothetical protein
LLAIERDFNAQKYASLNSMCEVFEFKVLLVDDPKPTPKLDVKVVDILDHICASDHRFRVLVLAPSSLEEEE